MIWVVVIGKDGVHKSIGISDREGDERINGRTDAVFGLGLDNGNVEGDFASRHEVRDGDPPRRHEMDAAANGAQLSATDRSPLAPWECKRSRREPESAYSEREG